MLSVLKPQNCCCKEFAELLSQQIPVKSLAPGRRKKRLRQHTGKQSRDLFYHIPPITHVAAPLHPALTCSKPVGTKIITHQKIWGQGGDECIQTVQILQNYVFVQHLWDGGRCSPHLSPQPPQARLPRRARPQGRDQLFIHREDFPPVKTGIQWIRLDFFNSNIKCLEQIYFAAPAFIMQEELSLIR